MWVLNTEEDRQNLHYIHENILKEKEKEIKTLK
jgi:hypothetical protein